MSTLTQPGRQSEVTRSLLLVALLLQLTHLLALWLLPHPFLASNILQALCAGWTAVVCLHERSLEKDAAQRRYWLFVTIAFFIAATAQTVFTLLPYLPFHQRSSIEPDDVLWLLFGLPLLLAAYMNHEADRIGWIDRIQVGLFITVLYLLTLLPSIHFNLDATYLIQDAGILLCCFLRLPFCATARERRFFYILTIFLVVYGVSMVFGTFVDQDQLSKGTFYDLHWTLPNTLLSVLVLLNASRLQNDSALSAHLVRVARNFQGLNTAALAFLSLAVSALLATHLRVMGGALLLCSFFLFVLRINARERAWHQAHGQLEKTVLQDALTGLGNRSMLQNSLAAQLAETNGHQETALIFVDLDRFKIINDTLGHALGDQLLLEVAARLHFAAPADAIVCRYGGDEFVVLIHAQDADVAKRVGHNFLTTLRRPFRIKQHVLRSTASIGVVLAVAGESADDLLRAADHAMYRAKQLGKDCVQVFDATLRSEMNTSWQMEANLRHSIEQNAIEVVFQPLLHIERGTISGFEALARWSHPQHGQVPPSDFIPLAEKTGLILTLGSQMLEKACRQVASWNCAWGTQLSLSVNVSPRQLGDANILSMILSTLDRTGLSPHLLCLEITETALLVDQATAKDTLAKARAHGIHIALDDFGTGYSSLSFLLSLPVDEVKVDKSFVSNLHRDSQRKELVRAVVQLGKSLGKRIVAEGVETEEEFCQLAAMRCDCAQGWLISRPLSAEVMEQTLPTLNARVARPTLVPAPETRTLLMPSSKVAWTDSRNVPRPTLESAC